MAISWVTALKMVPWGDVIQAAPSVLKAAKGLMKKSPEQTDATSASAAPAEPMAAPLASNAGELALRHIAQLEARIQELEAAQRASNLVLEYGRAAGADCSDRGAAAHGHHPSGMGVRHIGRGRHGLAHPRDALIKDSCLRWFDRCFSPKTMQTL